MKFKLNPFQKSLLDLMFKPDKNIFIIEADRNIGKTMSDSDL